MMTVSTTRKASNANWSWRRTPIFGGRTTCRAVRRLFAGQQLHERRLAGAVRTGEAVAAAGENVVVTSSKRTFDPNRIDTP